MEVLSNAAFWVALALSIGATLTAWAAFLPVPRATTRLRLATAGAGGGGTIASSTRTAATFGSGLLARGVLVALVVSLGARWAAEGHPPLASLSEFTTAFAMAVAAFQLVGGRRMASSAADLLVQPLLLGLLLIAAALPSRIEPLAPSLRSENILVAHVTVMLAAYAALTVSFAAALLQLWQSSRRVSSRLPGARAFDAIAYRSVAVGFPLLAAGIALGAYWASTAWGRYWSWDPKETSSLVTWLAYGAYFHLHSLRGWAGRRSALVLVAAYGCVLFSYFVVNLLVSGLHSYGGM